MFFLFYCAYRSFTMENKTVQCIHSVVQKILPKVISVLVLEYITVVHELKQIKQIELRMDTDAINTINSEKIWMFMQHTKTLISKNIGETTYNRDSIGIFAYTQSKITEIFVFYDRCIYVFNDKCKLLRKMHVLHYHIESNIVVVNGKIYLYSELSSQFIYVYDLNGVFLVKLDIINCIKSIKIVDDNMYALLQCDKIIKINTIDSTTNEKIYKTKIIFRAPFSSCSDLNDFCIIDDYIYVANDDSIQKYDMYNKYVNTFRYGDVDKLLFDKHKLYVFESSITYEEAPYNLWIYDVKYKNMTQLLK